MGVPDGSVGHFSRMCLSTLGDGEAQSQRHRGYKRVEGERVAKSTDEQSREWWPGEGLDAATGGIGGRAAWLEL